MRNINPSVTKYSHFADIDKSPAKKLIASVISIIEEGLKEGRFSSTAKFKVPEGVAHVVSYLYESQGWSAVTFDSKTNTSSKMATVVTSIRLYAVGRIHK